MLIVYWTASKGRISLDSRLYFHPDLATLIGEHVVVRRTTHYGPPDSIEVFNNGIWVCTAVAINSDLADAISDKDVREGQKAQRRNARQHINAARQALKDDDLEAGEQQSIEQQAEDSRVADQMGVAFQDPSSTSDADTSGQSASVTSATPEDEQGAAPSDSGSKQTASPAKPQRGSFLQRLGRQAKERQQEGDSHE